MNKVILSAVLACGLLLLDSPEAAAHEERVTQERWSGYDRSDRGGRDYYYSRGSYRGDHYGSKYKRVKKMPSWLKRDRSFRRWFEHSRVSKNRRLSWNQLFDIYRWEHSYRRYRSSEYRRH